MSAFFPGLKCQCSTYTATAVPVALGWNTNIGSIYFFAVSMTSKTPLIRLERGMLPGTCGITNFDNCNSGCRLVYLENVLANCFGVVTPKSPIMLRCTECG